MNGSHPPPDLQPDLDVDEARAVSVRLHRGHVVVFDGHSRFLVFHADGYLGAWKAWSYAPLAIGALIGANIAQMVLLADPALRTAAALIAMVANAGLIEVYRRAPRWDAFVKGPQ